MITIVNYGCGNIKAIQNVFNKLSIGTRVASKANELIDAQKIILPGVGTFDYAMQKLLDSGMFDNINELVLEKKIPVLGICVGVQLMTNSSDEGNLKGLGWINAEVKKFDEAKMTHRVSLPHMGWNDVYPTKSSKLFNELETKSRFYFLHSYFFDAQEKSDVAATAHYGFDFDAVVSRGHIHGVQCHPEKSHHWGAQLLKNFAEL